MKSTTIVSYDLNWPHVFDAERKLIKQALGAKCLEVHHIGSTAVPGLCAKPKIDIIAVVTETANIVSALESIGFTYKGEGNIPFKSGVTKRDQQHKINLHVFEEDHPEIELNLLFRGHLRAHPASLVQYGQLKKDLIVDEAAGQK